MPFTETVYSVNLGINKLLNDTNGDINDQRLGSINYPDHQVVPYSIYVIYIKFTKTGQPDVGHFLQVNSVPIQLGQVKGIIEDIAKRGRANNLGPPVINPGDPGLQPFGLQNIIWRRKSHVALVVDSRHWKLLKGTQGSAIVFNTNKGSVPNHTFFDANTIEVDVDPDPLELPFDDGKRSAIHFVNHMKKNDYGDDLGYKPDGARRKEIEKFIFDIYFEVDGMDGTKSIVIVDPDGSNEGPPIGPP
jgi:hypothetical protein